ncbi:hypothetical protein HN992_03130 [Candidatus Woesearchaeota archaeon]|jgi:hypothetical protein|nr:hypothetical protein [Candidatus Woesearchaeota archaeon]MBT3438948.1 hypothetical protein [Candidatus Woesearchaeota archaeon]MBT4206868.1 hypothetical protein [Candidatus Woesearchaeota archaeon]MBT4783553.1 hypothetical protein [Candidatus Woesearchaeota archaeon]MBT5042646.1 hypothetical protein [Candidatus Woesearchaeota archaeon]
MKRNIKILLVIMTLFVISSTSFVYGQTSSIGAAEDSASGQEKLQCPGAIAKNQDVKACGTGSTQKEADSAAQDEADQFCHDTCTDTEAGHNNAQGDAKSCNDRSFGKKDGKYHRKISCGHCQCYDADGVESELINP